MSLTPGGFVADDSQASRSLSATVGAGGGRIDCPFAALARGPGSGAGFPEVGYPAADHAQHRCAGSARCSRGDNAVRIAAASAVQVEGPDRAAFAQAPGGPCRAHADGGHSDAGAAATAVQPAGSSSRAGTSG